MSWIKQNRWLLQRTPWLKSMSGCLWRTPNHGAEDIAQASWRQTGTQDKNPPRADARILPFAADVAVARARGRDAAFPGLAARPRPDGAAVANFARARLGRH